MNLFAATTGKNETTTTTATYSSPTTDSRKYAIKERFAGQNFFDDPTNGQVDYLSKEDATSAGLAYVQSDGVAVIKVDNTTKLEKGQPRKSVRIQSNKQYNGGLIVADILQMPFGCSVTYWTVGDNWPNNGEIDILENVNLATANQYTLHTGPNSTCTLDANPAAKFKSTSNMMGKVCASKEGANAGCGFSDPEPASYGQAFNAAGGAVIAMEWQNTGIRIWRFKRDSIPTDLQGDATNPNPDTWGAPVASWTDAACDIANEVKKHNIIINTTLCGGWAGDAYAGSGCPTTCTEQIMEPSNYDSIFPWSLSGL
ncbi:glycoside hydrolase family 16 protein [Rhizoctonia solani]|nr:glycoside hydrolase family 16 protein [Rhizoctonia solani]